MGAVVTGFNLRTAGSFLQSGLGNSQRRILGGNIALETLNVSFLLSNFLKDFKLLNSSQWGEGGGDGGRISQTSNYTFRKELFLQKELCCEDIIGKYLSLPHASLLIDHQRIFL